MTGRLKARASAAVVVLLAAAAIAGCQTPCEADEQCESDMFCGEEGFCDQQCDADGDCGFGEFCNRGACLLDARPVVRWLSPAEGADVGETFDVEVEVHFRAREAVIELQRDPTAPGEPCAPLVPRRIVVDGDPDQAVVQVVTFRDVPALGSSFGMQARSYAPSTEPFTARRRFAGTIAEDLGGFDVSQPREGFVDADQNVTVELEATLDANARLISGWTAPELGAATPRRVLAEDAREVSGRMPLARGSQIVWLEADLPGGVRRCGIGLATEPTQRADGIEVALAFDGPEPTNLDLWIYADLDDDGQSKCAADPPSGVCAVAWSQPGLRKHGEEAVLLPEAEGIYGVAVAPAAATDPASAFVRVSNRNVHLGFFGPRSVLADEGQVWLSGRVLVLGGTVSLEPLDQMVPGLPAAPASAW